MWLKVDSLNTLARCLLEVNKGSDSVLSVVGCGLYGSNMHLMDGCVMDLGTKYSAKVNYVGRDDLWLLVERSPRDKECLWGVVVSGVMNEFHGVTLPDTYALKIMWKYDVRVWVQSESRFFDAKDLQR